LSEERELSHDGLILTLYVRNWLPDSIERAIRIANALRIVHRQDSAESTACCVAGGKKGVGIGVAHVHVDAPTTANDIAARARHVERKPDARLDVVLILLWLEPSVLQAADTAEQARGARGLHLHEVRIQ
jgi:hypothetical protein